jgi:23S rRNA pseudouridine1911/1915/1917 synthase
MRISALLAEGACVVNGVARHAGYRLRENDVVKLLADEGAPSAMTPEEMPLEIVYDDAELLVVDKPAGLLVHPTRGTKSGTLANGLSHYLNRAWLADSQPSIGFVRPGIVHRLDRATSGLLVVAKTQQALSRLAQHFNRRLVEKRYVALLCGRVELDELRIAVPIGRDNASRPQWRVLEDGKPAETELRVVERSENETLVELSPLTGRTNQLRIHCAHVRHPIVGDVWYGAAAGVRGRLCLHAARLAFNHPNGKGWMEFESPAPFSLY